MQILGISVLIRFSCPYVLNAELCWFYTFIEVTFIEVTVRHIHMGKRFYWYSSLQHDHSSNSFVSGVVLRLQNAVAGRIFLLGSF